MALLRSLEEAPPAASRGGGGGGAKMRWIAHLDLHEVGLTACERRR